MNNKIIRAAIFFMGFAFAGATHAFVGTIAVGLGEMNEDVGRIQVSFAADAKLETQDMTANSRIHYQPGMVRDEMDMAGQKMVTIRRFDLNKLWMIMGQGMYMERDPEEGGDQAPDYQLVSREIVGRETINGMETTKYKSVYKSKDGKFGGFTWFTDDNIAVKGFMISETNGAKERMKFEITKLDRGPQDASLFEIPAGYKKFDMGNLAGMGAMQQQQMQQMKQAQQQAQQQQGSQAPSPYGTQPQQAGQQQEDGGFVEDVAEESAEEAKDAASDEIVQGIGSGVRKGFGKLFGR